MPLDDEKSVNRTVDEAVRRPRGGGTVKPARNPAWNTRTAAVAELAAARKLQTGRRLDRGE